MRTLVRADGHVVRWARRAGLLMLAASLAAPSVLAADVSDTDWEVLMSSQVVVRGVGRSAARGLDMLHFTAVPGEGERAGGTFHFDRSPLTGEWREARDRWAVGRLDRDVLAGLIVERLNERLGVTDTEVVRLSPAPVRIVVGDEGRRLRMRAGARALVSIPSLGLEERPVLLRLRVRGRAVGEESDPES